MYPVIERAQKVMDEIQRDEGLLHAYQMYEMSLSDETSKLNFAREKGIKQGHKEVLGLLRKGHSIEEIEQILEKDTGV
jgi:hypothetical protein